MVVTLTQANRPVAVTTALGEDVLLLRSMSGSEHLGQPYEYELNLIGESAKVDSDKLLGDLMTVRLDLPGNEKRFFNGYVSRFVRTNPQGDIGEYRATLVPWIWLLTRIADCRIFQDMTVPEIIIEVFRSRGFDDFDDAIKSTHYRKLNYCVQYRETDFNFVSRLMEQEGIYYYFDHQKTEGKHTLVLADQISSHGAFPGYSEIRYRLPNQAASDGEYVTDWSVERTIQPGKYVLKDFDFVKPEKAMLTDPKQIIRAHAFAELEIYDYPGEYVELSDGNGYAEIRIQEQQARYEVGYGTSDARGVSTGYTFKLTNHPDEDPPNEYLVTSATYHIESDAYGSGLQAGGEVYSCSFTTIRAQEPFRPARTTPKPTIQGPQTAIVTGLDSQEIDTDEHGRVKVKFHWDRATDVKPEDRSCWIRVAQLWAGQGWGAAFTPRIGQEVIVEFLEGDPDQPIITGRVYNGKNPPPFGHKTAKTQSGVKSRSSKGGTPDNYNEIRFEDKKGEEQVIIHGEKDISGSAENDMSLSAGHDMSISVGHDKTESVKNNSTETVTKNKKITVDGTHTEDIKGITAITIKEGALTHKVNTGTATYEVKGAVAETYKDTQKTTVTNQIKIESTSADIDISAATQIKLSTGSSSLTMKSDGTIELSGKDVTIKGTATAAMAVNSQNVTCNNQKVATSGAAISASAIGIHEVSGALIKLN